MNHPVGSVLNGAVPRPVQVGRGAGTAQMIGDDPLQGIGVIDNSTHSQGQGGGLSDGLM
jgi:hypothetical protein